MKKFVELGHSNTIYTTMTKKWYRSKWFCAGGFTFLSILSCTALLTTSILFAAGPVEEKRKLTETECTITNHTITQKPYCTKDCWDGDIVFTIKSNNKLLTLKSRVIDRSSEYSVEKRLISKYPIGSVHKCWYDHGAQKVKFDLAFYNSFLAGLIINIIITIGFIITAIVSCVVC